MLNSYFVLSSHSDFFGHFYDRLVNNKMSVEWVRNCHRSVDCIVVLPQIPFASDVLAMNSKAATTIPTTTAPVGGQVVFYTSEQVHRLGLTVVHSISELPSNFRASGNHEKYDRFRELFGVDPETVMQLT
jgi:hypothetical protein